MACEADDFEMRANGVVEQAEAAAAEVTTWADWSNRLFSPRGIVSRWFPTMDERRAFVASPQYRRLNEMQLALMRKFGTVAGANPQEETIGE
jgi:nicotinamide mononucleotide adenylyltransferase